VISNCLILAVKKWRKEGGYLCIRLSRHKHWFPIKIHVLWHPEKPNDCFEHFTPKKSLGKLPPPVFKGEWKKGD